MSDDNEKDPIPQIKSRLVNLDITKIKGRGRKSFYNFREIPDGEEKIFENVNPHNVQAALHQFMSAHGGVYSTKKLSAESIAVLCLAPAPNA